MQQCSVCHETEGLTPYVARSLKGKEVNLNLCQKHLKLAGFDVEIEILPETKEEWRDTLCCATQINSNGHCSICGDKVI